MVYALSAAVKVRTPPIEGMTIHDPADPVGTFWHFRYGQIDRSDSFDVTGEAKQFEGREFPVYAFGTSQSQVASMQVDIPAGPNQRREINAMRELGTVKRTLCYRDGRGRKLFGVIVGFKQADNKGSVGFSIDVRRVNYSEGETLTEVVPVVSNYDFTYVRKNTPGRTEVYDASGWAATFTDGCVQVNLRGPTRVFQDTFKPYVDQFKRDKVASLGTAPGGGAWQLQGGLDSERSVDGTKSKTVVATENESRRANVNALIRYPHLKARLALDKVPGGALFSDCISFGYSGTSNHYLARVAVNPDASVTTRIDKVVGGAQETIANSVTVGAVGSYVAGQKWWIEAQVTAGGIVRTKAWKDGTTQPSAWTCSSGDTTFPQGKVGRRSLAATGTTNLPITSSCDWFEVISAELVDPVTVQDGVYVHYLDLPFNGDATAYAGWLREALTDPLTGDIRKIMWEYVNGAPAVMDEADPTLQIAGDADYGPLFNTGRSFDLGHANDGTRQEGSDWSDYLGVTGSYANGDVDPPEAHQFRSLDCSGYVRMCAGYRGGIPLTTDTTPAGDPLTDDGDRTAIPRVSFNQGRYGPGVIVAQGNPPALTNIQIGDLVAFDADQSNPDEQEGQVDHVGFYFGRDQNGNHVFISSRKTVSGPTIGNLGGASNLNGTGLYARTLIIIRRF